MVYTDSILVKILKNLSADKWHCGPGSRTEIKNFGEEVCDIVSR